MYCISIWINKNSDVYKEKNKHNRNKYRLIKWGILNLPGIPIHVLFCFVWSGIFGGFEVSLFIILFLLWLYLIIYTCSIFFFLTHDSFISYFHASALFFSFFSFIFIILCIIIFFSLLQRNYTEEDLMALLPSKRMTLDIMVITKLLSNRGTKSLGDFEMQYLYDPVGVNAAKE